MPTLPLKFDGAGLVPAILQDYVTGEIRMFAFASDAAVRSTLESGRATFWSRSRGELWQKGRASGYETPIVRVLADCDGDCVVYSSDPLGPSCFSGARSCFFQAFEDGQLRYASEQPQTVLASLEASVAAEATNRPERASVPPGSNPEAPVAAARMVEKVGTLAKALETESNDRVVSEAADLIYRVVAALRSRSITLRQVLAEVARKRGFGVARPPT
ncbi:MAG TPA: phosphoribosyl-AMP cyclohydrolase [Polyangiaceae bacterium]|nr:phosphoribosyl-AMP cyclohydrolase [Polyangiaceae bacterium]